MRSNNSLNLIPDEVFNLCEPLIKEFEGLRLVKYRDIVGFWTIGYGHRCSEDQQDITLQEAEDLLKADIQLAYASLIRWSPKLQSNICSPPESSVQLCAALVDFVYNLGSDRYCRSTLRKIVDSIDYSLVPLPVAALREQLVRWQYARDPNTAQQVSVPGLLRRREAEIALLSS